MNAKLLIVADVGILKAYELTITSTGLLHLDQVKTEVLNEAQHSMVEKLDFGTTVNSCNIKLETKRRLVKRIAQSVEELIEKNSEWGVWLAAPKEINYLLTSALLKCVRQRIETNLTLNLVHVDEEELLERFAPPALVKLTKNE